MDLRSQKISAKAFMYTVACFLMGSTLLTTIFSLIAGRDSWFIAVLGAALGLGFAFIYFKLQKAYPNLNLAALNEKILGKPLGKAVSLAYLVFFITLAGLNAADVGDFITLNVLPQTPKLIITAVFLGLCAFAVYRGLPVLTGYMQLFVFTGAIFLLTVFLLTLSKGSLNNLLPFFNQPLIKYIEGSHTAACLPFGELIIFFALTPQVKEKETVPKAFYAGYAMGFAAILFTSLLEIKTLGPLDPLLITPPFETLRIVTINEVLSRLEIIFSAMFVMLFFAKVSLLYYVCLIMLGQIFNFNNLRSLILITGAFILFYSQNLWGSARQPLTESLHQLPFIWSFFEVVLPGLTLIVCLIKQKRGHVQ